MEQEILKNKFDKQYFAINTSSLPDFLDVEWQGFVPERTDALKGMQLVVDYAEKYRVPGVLNDNIKGNGPWPIKPQDAKEWLETLERIDVRKLAHVVAGQVFGAMSAKMLEEHNGDLTVKYFKNRSEAETWLKTA